MVRLSTTFSRNFDFFFQIGLYTGFAPRFVTGLQHLMLGPARIWPESTFISNEATFSVHVSAIPRYTMGSGVIIQISPFPAITIAVKISFPCPRQKQAYFKDDMPMSCYNLHCTLYHNVGRREKKTWFLP